jgi:hypothetical protein
METKTPKQIKSEVAEIVARVDSAQRSYNVANFAHFQGGGRMYNTPGPTLDAMSAAWSELKSALEVAKRMSNMLPNKIGIITVTDHPEYSRVNFVSASDARKSDAKNRQFRAWENSRA